MADEASRIRVYIDEDIWDGLSAALRARGYDSLTVREAGRIAKSDREQLEFAASEQRAILIYNFNDYSNLAQEYFYAGREHRGIVMSVHLKQGELLRRVLAFLEAHSPEDVKNTVRFLETTL